MDPIRYDIRSVDDFASINEIRKRFVLPASGFSTFSELDFVQKYATSGMWDANRIRFGRCKDPQSPNQDEIPNSVFVSPRGAEGV